MVIGKYDVQGELRKWFVGADRIVVAGIGNPIRTDDFVGVKIVQNLQDKIRTVGIYLIDADLLNSATDFVISTLISTASSLQLPIELVSILHKSDLIKINLLSLTL